MSLIEVLGLFWRMPNTEEIEVLKQFIKTAFLPIILRSSDPNLNVKMIKH